ncbi:MAG: single-stranded-DNA-specific exonuclease RecJ [Parvularculaceae bacterium]|nr:single-stranded-DNA-specific exonuclease RecJ [Parvularculaceae bacterium]
MAAILGGSAPKRGDPDKGDGTSFGAALAKMAMPASRRRWVLSAPPAADVTAIEEELNCPLLLARLLAARNIQVGRAARYLNPSLKEDLPDPSTLKDMDKAADRIASAIIAGQKCGVFGDYDVDGASGAAILKRYFSSVGAELSVYLPDRILEGYGPTIEAFRSLRETGADPIVTVDCGALAHAPVDAAAAEGMEIIVLDHHQMDGPPPKGALATVNPNRRDDNSGLRELSAAGVAFMAVIAVNRILRARGYFRDRPEPDLTQLLDLVALGLVCDVMPMTGVARTLTAQGLKMLAHSGNPGLVALGRRAGMGADPTTYDLGFLIGPRINAAGRIGHARLAFELMTSDDAERRAELVERLHVMNAQRQEIERAVLDAARAQIERDGRGEAPVIVAAGEGWHPGVVGIVAGRLKDKFDRPTIVIGIENGVGKGSARSVTGVDIGLAIRSAQSEGILVSGGGHEMAAGLTAAADKIDALTDYLADFCRDAVDRALANRTRTIDALVAPSAVSAETARVIAALGPFGPGNPEPVFALEDMRIDRTRVVGTGHLSCDLVGPSGERVRAIAFRAQGERLGDMLTTAGRAHLAGRIKADTWRGGGAGQFQIIDAAEAI